MKVVYTERTLNIMIELYGMDYVKGLTESGDIKQIEEVTNYLVICEN